VLFDLNNYKCIKNNILSSYDKILKNICGYCEIFAEMCGIVVAMAAILVNNTKLLCCGKRLAYFHMLFFGHVPNEILSFENAFIAIFGGLFGIMTGLGTFSITY
jgi:hypothetical protein